MDLTVQILTRNNEKTIESTIESLLPYSPQIIIGDMKSNDNTVILCKRFGKAISAIEQFGHTNYGKARNELLKYAKFTQKLAMYGNETIHSNLNTIKSFSYANVLRDNVLTKEIRLFTNTKFINHIFECPIDETIEVSDLIITGKFEDAADKLSILNVWKSEEPISPKILYYEALLLFSLKQYEKFKNVCEHYFFLNNFYDKQSIMMRYYYAALMFIVNNPIACLQNLTICLSHKPSMAEFWCLAGDVYYHLYGNKKAAMELYHNALVLGQHRLNNDTYPMDINKYEDYPMDMINLVKAG